MRHGRQVVRGSGENNEGLCERTGEGPDVDQEPSQAAFVQGGKKIQGQGSRRRQNRRFFHCLYR